MSTATQATPVAVTFRERISGLSRKELVEIAKDEFQLNIDSKVKAAVLRDTLIRIHEDHVTTTMEKNQAASQLFLERDSSEKLLTVQFLPLEFPNNPEQFSWDGGFGIRDRKNPSKNPTGLSRMANYLLIPGEIYQLPLCVVKHLESKTYRDSKPQFDTETGMISGNIPIIKPRFMLKLIVTDEVMDTMGQRDFKKG